MDYYSQIVAAGYSSSVANQFGTFFETKGRQIAVLEQRAAEGRSLPNDVKTLIRLRGQFDLKKEQLASAPKTAAAGTHLYVVQSGPGKGLPVSFANPPLPHPDASNLALGPNLGGQDAVVDTPTTASTGTGSGASGAGGLLLLGVVGVLVFVALRRK